MIGGWPGWVDDHQELFGMQELYDFFSHVMMRLATLIASLHDLYFSKPFEKFLNDFGIFAGSRGVYLTRTN